uniref:Transcriptional regulatory protein qseB n=1 Tax=mine drainage metagenome TaxID=410659 RepID=E6QUD1_9ZZZZ
MRILLIEDDLMIGDAVSVALKDHAYAVNWVKNGLAIDSLLKAEVYQAVLLDLGLPKRDGLEVLRRIRQHDDAVPVLIISARDDIKQRILALDGGADDYLIKPFDVQEMLARLRAVLRRQNGHAMPLLGHELLSLDPSSREARSQGVSHLLSAREFALLRALLLRHGTILSRSELEERIYGWGEEVESNAVEVLIHGLRKKLGAEAIKNVRGAGWMAPKK